jgi:flagellar biosynthesis/type III secretory pathway protein FliH
MALETAKLEQNGEVNGANLQLATEKLMVEAEKNQAKAQNDTDKVMLEAQKTQEALTKAEDSGYQQGVSDGVDAAYGG